jgi:hypothetical protein
MLGRQSCFREINLRLISIDPFAACGFRSRSRLWNVFVSGEM